jgi:3',5'-nucleoside bisphosphate phosphatase
MKSKPVLLVFLLLLCGCFFALSQTRTNYRLPNIPGYLTLKGDFHMHTPFSDGTVWPADRVMEAWRDGLDVISITDHVEYMPNKKDVSTDLNRPWEIAKPTADKYGILLIKAAEITRGMPPGHFNAYFLNDANALKQKDVNDAFKAASDQGAFFVWNHPGWKAQQPDTTIWFPMHTEYLNKGWLHGIEVLNEKEYYPIVHQWANEKNLAFFANSDVHGPIDFLYESGKNQRRPMTLVFAKERTIDAVREAFFNKQTLAYFNDTLLGNLQWLKPMVEACMQVQDNYYQVDSRKTIHLILNNLSDFPLNLSGQSNADYSLPKQIYLEANGSVSIPVRINRNLKVGENEFSISLNVLNALSAPNSPITVHQTIVAFYLEPPRIVQTGADNWQPGFDSPLGALGYFYTTNGQNPTTNSKKINEPFQAKDQVNLKVAAYKNDRQAGSTVEYKFLLHRAIGQPISLTHLPAKKYIAYGPKSLLDGILGSENHNDGNWTGFEQNDLEAIIELEKPQNIKSVELRFIESTGSWVFLPKSVQVYTSTDGKSYKQFGKKDFAEPKPDVSRGIVATTFTKSENQVKFIKIVAVNQGLCPVWHGGKGKPAWLFADELIIR